MKNRKIYGCSRFGCNYKVLNSCPNIEGEFPPVDEWVYFEKLSDAIAFIS